MDAGELFLETLRDLERYVAEANDYSMLRASGLLRQLLVDKHALMHQVNRAHMFKLRFPVCGRAYRETVLADAPIFYSALGGIHSSGAFPHQLEEVSLDRFLATQVLKLGDQLLTIADLISISANVLGGIHKGDPATEKEQALAEFSRSVTAGGRALNAAQLKPIILVVLDALRPLREAVAR